MHLCAFTATLSSFKLILLQSVVKRKTVIRLVILVTIMVTLALLARYTSLGSFFSFSNLQDAMVGAGIPGIVIFLATFGVGTLMNIPGFIFIIVAILVYGFGIGIPVAYLGAFLSVLTHFSVVRIIGGSPFKEIKQPFVRKMMDKLAHSPVKTIVILRILFFISPPVNYALALSNVKLPDFVIGTLIGMVFPMSVLCLFLYFAKDTVMAWLL